MATAQIEVDIDWMACDLIESVPGKVSGMPVVRGTRIMPDAILNSFKLGDTVEEIHEGFPTLSLNQIKRLIEFGEGELRKLSASRCIAEFFFEHRRT